LSDARGLLHPEGDARRHIDEHGFAQLIDHPVVARRNTFWETAGRFVTAFVSRDERKDAIFYEFDGEGLILSFEI